MHLRREYILDVNASWTCCEAQMTPRKKLVNTLSFMDVHVLRYIYLVKGDRSMVQGKQKVI